MSEQLLALLRFSLLGLLYLFMFRVVRAVWAELRPTRTTGAAPFRRSDQGGDDPEVAGRARSGVPLSAPPANVAAAVPTPPPPGPAASPIPSRHPGSGGSASQGSVGACELVVVSPAELAGVTWVLHGAEQLMGRSSQCTLVVDDSFVSGRHARFAPTSHGWSVEDLGSTNGTWVNGEQVSGPQVLRAGDHVAVGGVVMELR